MLEAICDAIAGRGRSPRARGRHLQLAELEEILEGYEVVAAATWKHPLRPAVAATLVAPGQLLPFLADFVHIPQEGPEVDFIALTPDLKWAIVSNHDGDITVFSSEESERGLFDTLKRPAGMLFGGHWASDLANRGSERQR